MLDQILHLHRRIFQSYFRHPLETAYASMHDWSARLVAAFHGKTPMRKMAASCTNARQSLWLGNTIRWASWKRSCATLWGGTSSTSYRHGRLYFPAHLVLSASMIPWRYIQGRAALGAVQLGSCFGKLPHGHSRSISFIPDRHSAISWSWGLKVAVFGSW